MLQQLFTQGLGFSNNINPSQFLFTEYEAEVIDVRKTLFEYLGKISPAIENQARNILENKVVNGHSPLMGELFPWLIQEIVQLDNTMAKNIAVGWLSFYLYTLFLDSHLDKQIMISPEELLSLSILEKKGLLDLQRFVIGSKYEQLFNESLDKSIIGEIQDFHEQSCKDRNFNIEEISKKKNYLLLSCVSAFAASNNEKADFIFQITDSFLLIMQYLDDLGDWEEDINEKHLSLLTIDLFREADVNMDIFNMKHDKVIEQLIISGTLFKVLNRINELLRNQILLLESSKEESKYRIHKEYFTRLYTENLTFIEEVDFFQHRYIQLSLIERIQVIEGIKREINIVAQSS